jgi:hypothetical protein
LRSWSKTGRKHTVKSIILNGRSLRNAVWMTLPLLVFAGCGRGDVQVYHVAKEGLQTSAGASQPAGMGTGGGEDADALPQLKWKLPEGWQEVPPGQMRVASFRVTGKDSKMADVSVVPLPGLAGSDLDNVNRWRSQVGLGPVSDQELSKLAESLEIAGQTAQLYDQAGQNPGSAEKTRILAAVMRSQGVAWFFKMTGDDELVAQQKPAFVGFLKSIAFGPASGAAGLPPSHPPIGGSGMMPQAGQPELPASHPPINGAAPAQPDATSAQPKPAWQPPADWHEVSGGQFLVAKFNIGDDTQTSVNVSMSPGDGGGLVANVNRWRGQLDLAPLGESEVTQQCQSLEASGGKATLVDIAGTDSRNNQKSRLLAVIVPQGDKTWFYKLMGNEQTVGLQKDTFTKFVQTVKY